MNEANNFKKVNEKRERKTRKYTKMSEKVDKIKTNKNSYKQTIPLRGNYKIKR